MIDSLESNPLQAQGKEAVMASGLPHILRIDLRRPRATPKAAAWDYEFTAATDRDMPDGEARFSSILKKFPEGWKAAAHEGLPWPREGHAHKRDAVRAALPDIYAMLVVLASAHRVLAQTTAEDDAKVTARFAVEMLKKTGLARANFEIGPCVNCESSPVSDP